MALSNSILEKIKKDKEDKQNGVKDGTTSTKDKSTQGSNSSSGSSLSSTIQDRVAMDYALKQLGLTHNKDTGLLNDSRYSNYRSAASSVDQNYINKFYSDWKSYNDRMKAAYDGMNWQTAQTWGQDKELENTGKDLMFRSAMIRSYLDSHKDDLDEESYRGLVTDLENIQKAKGEYDSWFTNTKKFYSQWKTEEEYNFWQDHSTVENRQNWYEEQQKRLEDLKSQKKAENARWNEALVGYDPESHEFMTASQEFYSKQKAIDDEIAAVEAEMANYKRGNYNEFGQYYGNKTLDDYHAITERPDFKVTSANRDYDNPTREELWEYDSSASEGSVALGYGGSYDEEGNILDINGNIVRYAKGPEVEDKLGMFFSAGEKGVQEAYNQLSINSGNYTDTWANIMQEGDTQGWKYLDDTEIGIYYALLDDSQEAAYKFLADMAPELTRRETMAKKAYIEEAPVLEQILLNAASIPMNVVGGGVAFAADVISGIKGEEINPYSRAHAMQNTASFIREDAARDINNLTGNVALPWVGTTFGDVYQSLMSAGDMAYGAMLGGGGQVYATLMGMGAASAEAKRLYDQGASMEQIAAGGILAGAAEMVFEKLSIENLINMKDAKSASQLIKNLLTQGGIEASEEMATEIANTITNVIVMGKQSDWVDLETFARNVVNAGIGGFISGGFGGGVGSVASYSQYNQQAKDTGKTIMEAEGGVDALKALAMDVSGADSKLAKQANKVTGETVDGKGLKATVQNNRSQKAVGKLYDTVQTEVTKQNQSDIAKRIEEVGFSPKSAKNIASAVMAQVNGEELSKVQKAALDIVKGNEKVQEAINGILEDGSSSVNKRNVNLTKYALGINLGVGIAPDASRTNPAEAGKEIASTEGNLTTEVKRVSEGSYEVSEDGKAVLDGQEVKLDGFRKTDDGTIMVATADSLTADPGEVTYSSKGQALVYENYANIETTTSNPVIANMDINSRSALAKAYDPASGVDAKVYFLGANQAWWYGFRGIPMTEKSLSEDSFVKSIAKEQRDFAYEQGRKAGETAAKTQGKGVQAAYEKAVEKLGGKEAAKAVAKRNKGEVVLDSGIKKSSMTKQQRGSVQMAKVVAEATGTTIHVYHGVKEYGKYDTNTGEILLNINAMFTGQSMMAFTLGHELVHMAKQWSPAEFKDFADYLLEQYGKKGVSIESLILEQMANAKRNQYELNEDEAYEEVIADACQRMLLDSDAVQKMAAYKAENPTRWQQIIDAIKEFIDKIRQLFVGAEPDSTEASIYKELDAAVKEHLENKFVTMVMDAGEHLSTIRNAFGKGTVVEVNENGEFTLAKGEVNGATKFLYNDYTWENGGRETLAAALKAEGFSKEDIDAALTIMDGKHDLVKDLAKQFPEQDRINQVTITTDIKDGHSVLSALVSNGDYPVNIDLLMVCKKRKAYQRVINRLCETGLIQQATVDALAIAEINKILGKYGFETACLGCFVESRRLRIQEWAQTICKEWNAEVKKRNPNAKAFGFGKGEAKLTADEVMQLIGELESGGEKNDQGNLNLGQGSAVKRMGVLLDKVPSLRKTLSIEDLITPDGLSSLRRFDSNLFSMVKSRYGSNSPKFVQEFNPYNHELAKYGKVPTEYSSLREYLYAIGGARMQSFSDFIVENWFDYCQIVADLATRKLPMHTYTKEIALVKLFGLTGIKINMSLIPDIDRSLGKEYAGLTRNAKGELELIWADKDRFKATGGKSYMQSINFADAIALQNDPRYSANVGTIAVGVSDQHILMMLDDARIRMIIPYHSSGMNPIFADLMGTSYYKDYTMFQNTTVKQLYNSKGQKVSLKLDKTQTGKLTSGFQFNEVLQELGDARAAAEAYKEWCADASKHTITIKGETYTAELTPKFDDFSGHENYYKLLEDFNTYDCISEQAAPQGDVQQNYPEDFDKILTDELKAQEGHRQKQVANQAFDKAMGEIETYLKSHTKADTVFYAEQHGVKLSAKDKKLGAEDKKKLADLRKGEKMSMPKNQKAPTYEELIAKKPIAVIDIGNNEEGLSYAKLKETVLKNAEKNKVFEVPHPNRDTKVLIFLTQKSFTHAFSNLTKDFGEDTILAMDHISEIIHEAVLTHIAPPKNPRKAESRVFSFFAAIEGKNGIEPVKLTVKEYVGQKLSEIPENIRKYFEENGVQETHNRLYDAEVLEVISVESAKKESGASASVANRKRLGAKGTPNSTIKIADLLGLVNGDAEKYIPKPASDKNKSHNSRGMSSRQLLANAFDELAQTPKERELMAQYRNHITKVDEVQERLKKLRGEISRLTNANGDKNKIATMNKTAAELADIIDKYDRKLLELEASKPLRDVLARAKSAAYQEAKQRSEKTMQEYRQQVSERFDRGVEGRRKTEMRHKIQNVVKELNDLLLNESKKRHVPDSLKKAVAGALSIVNMDTVDAEERASKYAALIAKEQSKAAPDQDKIDAYTVTMENILRQGEKMGQRLKELRDAYEEISESDDPDIANAYDPVIAGAMRELSQTIGNTSIRNMTLDQLSDVYDMYRMVLTRVRDANKTLLENIKESISSLASRVIGEVRITGGEHTYRAAVLDPVRKFLWDNMKPVYAMEWIGSSTLTKVFNNVRAGEDTWAKDVTEARGYYLEKSKKYGYDSWDFDKKYRFESASGIEFELTLEQILSLYAYSKRDQAHDHLRLGGFVFDSNIETYKEKGSKILKYKVNTAEAHQITPEILAAITGKLTKEQMGFVDEMQEYLSTVMGAKGNEVTSKMYGVKLFKEKFYFPLKSAKQFMFEQNEVSGEVRIKNSGFTNKVVAKANNPVILSNFMEVWAGHVNDMSMYHSFTLPLEDFNRVFNYNSPKKEGQPPVSVKGTIQGAYSPAAVHYVKNLITDLNGGARTDSTTGFINKMMGLFKKGSVFASMSVVVQQPSAIARAGALVDTKYFIGPKVDHKRHKALWDEVKQYAPVAVIKEMGYFDTNMGKSTQDYILSKEYDGFKDKMKALVNDSDYRDEALSKAPALADEVAWCGIWEAVKREMHDKYPGLDVKSEPFLMLCGSRFTEVITKTQVYDSVLSKSGNMRSKDTGMKMATAFMAEPTTSINMIADALLQGKRGNKKYARKAIGAVIASQILNSILVSFVYAGRDDDEDETYLEKYIGTFTGEMLDSLNPAGYIPFIKDIMSIVQGYDVERSDMAVISDFWKACENLKKDTLSPYRKVEGFVGSIAQIFGLPVKNIMRDVRGIWQTIDSFVNGQQTTGAGIGYAVKSALPKLIGGGDVSNDEQLYRATLSGNQAHLDRVKDRYANEKAVNSGMRSAIKEHYLAGDIDADTAIKYMVSYCGDDEDEAFWKVEEWRHDQKFEEDFGKYNEFYGAVQTGKELKAIIKKYTDNGVTNSTLKSQITEHFKEQYIKMSTAEKANIKGYLLNAFTLLGEDRADAEKRISAWEFEAKNGFNYDNRRELFLSGEITGDQVREAVITFGGKTAEEADKEVELLLFEAEYGFAYSEKEDLYKSGKITDSELKHILMSAGGKTAEEADLQIQAYDWEAQGYENVTAASVRDYNEHCSTANVPKDVYLHIRSFSNDTKNDVDANGKTIYYSAMKKVMAEINAQYGLTAEQKTAIARSLGWAEKNINKYKLW